MATCLLIQPCAQRSPGAVRRWAPRLSPRRRGVLVLDPNAEFARICAVLTAFRPLRGSRANRDRPVGDVRPKPSWRSGVGGLLAERGAARYCPGAVRSPVQPERASAPVEDA